jgi:hypothetical protein
VRLINIPSAVQRKDLGGLLDEFRILEGSVRAYNTSILKPELRDAIPQYADSLSEVCAALKQSQEHNSDAVIVGTFLDVMVRISQGDNFEPLSDRLSAEQKVRRDWSGALEKWQREKSALAARDPN